MLSEFFSLANPLKLKMMAGVAALFAIVSLSLSVWALWERSGRLSCKVEVATLSGKLEGMGILVNSQNASIAQAKRDAEAAQAESKKAIAKADAEAKQFSGERAIWAEILKNTGTPSLPDGTKAGCKEAIQRIHREVVK